MAQEQKNYYTKLRTVYASALLNGPFAIVIGHEGGMVGLNDRLKLRPLVAARKNNKLFIGSEEAAIRVVSDYQELDKVWTPFGGEMIMGRVKQ